MNVYLTTGCNECGCDIRIGVTIIQDKDEPLYIDSSLFEQQDWICEECGNAQVSGDFECINSDEL